jgi:hypothetical protein
MLRKSPEHILSLGVDLHDPRLTATQFGSPDAVPGHDLILWDLSSTFDDYELLRPDEMDYGGTTEGETSRFLADLSRRQAEMKEHLREGKPIVLFLGPPEQVRLHSEVFGINEAPPLSLRLTQARGQAFELVAGEPFAGFWREFGPFFTYHSRIEDPPGTPLLKIRDSKYVVATATQRESGLVLLLPALDGFEASSRDEIDEDRDQSHAEFIDALWGFARTFAGEAVLPDWTLDYKLPAELDAQADLERARVSVLRAQARAQGREKELAALRDLKLLFAGSGAALERVVDQAFRELGFEVEDDAPGRTDRVVKKGRRVAVVEVKGVKKSASEAHAAQLQKWVSDYHASHGRQPKGILVVNTWSSKKIEERDEVDFPPQMLPYAVEQQKMCLITGLQLLAAVLEARKTPKARDRIAKAILGCEGVFEEFSVPELRSIPDPENPDSA